MLEDINIAEGAKQVDTVNVLAGAELDVVTVVIDTYDGAVTVLQITASGTDECELDVVEVDLLMVEVSVLAVEEMSNEPSAAVVNNGTTAGVHEGVKMN